MIGERPTVFLLTDFGTSDHYVAAMKAVVLVRCPDVRFVDITHDVAPQAVEQGAYLLESTWPWLPEGSVVLAVVDPGVGSDREPAVFFHEGKCLVGPNNGLFGFLPAGAEGRVLDRPKFWLEEVSPTFHGRDIFAPCAAFVAAGGHWARLGSMSTARVRLDNAEQTVDELAGKEVTARIIHIDHFGNAITSMRFTGGDEFGATVKVQLESGQEVPVKNTYADMAPGEAIAYRGSTGRMEIAVRNGNARAALGLKVGDLVLVKG